MGRFSDMVFTDVCMEPAVGQAQTQHPTGMDTGASGVLCAVGRAGTGCAPGVTPQPVASSFE